tara:strand:+ start:118 stop:495 length:378 start_codon:yes stop_codon:yes gene_type:complete
MYKLYKMRCTARMLKYLFAVQTVLMSGFFSDPVHSGEIDLPAEILSLDGDPEYGEYLASDCKTCHEADGGGEEIPNIHGRPKIQLITLLYAYREKIKSNPVMQMQAGRLTNEEIVALAAYFEGLN